MGYDPHFYHPNFNRIFHEINIQLMTSQAILYPWTPFKLMIQPPIKLMVCSSMNQPPSVYGVYGLFLHQLYHYIYTFQILPMSIRICCDQKPSQVIAQLDPRGMVCGRKVATSLPAVSPRSS